MVDETAPLGKLPGCFSNSHTMTKSIFLRSLLAVTALIASPLLSTVVNAAVGDILETNEGNILRFRGVGTPSTFATGLTNPKGIVFDGTGHVYIADAGKNQVYVYTLPDGAVSVFATGLNSPVGLAFDTSGNLYVSESATGNIIKFAPDKTKTTFATNAGGPAGMAFDNSGNLFVADFSGNKVYKYDSAGGQTTFATGLNEPAGVAVDNAGNIFVSNSGAGQIFKFAPDGTQTTFSSNLTRPFGINFDAAGNLIAADNEDGATVRYSPDGTKSNIFQSEFNTPQFLAVEPAIHHLLNVSTRGLVQQGDNVLIAGFVVGGNGPVGTKVLVRALGPSLTPFGVANALSDPFLELHDASGALIASNNDWKDSQQAEIVATTLAPTNDREAAILTSLHGGAFTAVVRGVNGSTGTAVVEVYNLP